MMIINYEPEIVLASALRVHGADLIELSGLIMADRQHLGQVSKYHRERIGKAIADLAAEFAKFQAAPKDE